MNAVVTTPVALGTAAHKSYVTRLYRRSLRLAQDWYWQRTEYREKALMIRQLFDANRGNNNAKEVEAIIGHAEYTLATYFHSQPYRSPAAPGGTKWERNIPFPEELASRGMTPFDNSS
ncbi:hypothetical protein HDU85_000605 [Gaertneriomyces sp. JEL0708]|nr:hypothetical protein HDU85_000605 [Gaertneriomyces sp. JEL0708]